MNKASVLQSAGWRELGGEGLMTTVTVEQHFGSGGDLVSRDGGEAEVSEKASIVCSGDTLPWAGGILKLVVDCFTHSSPPGAYTDYLAVYDSAWEPAPASEIGYIEA
jgi:hypothetical protein